MDKLLYGLTVAVIGLIIVFAGLLLVILLIKIMGLIVGKMTAGKQPAASAAANTPVKPQAPAKPAANAEQSLVVAISAAVAAFTGLDQGHIAIRSIREIIPNK
ncbi:OadG family protein [Christensenellaceae bacterium NSJ-44]|uniref:OadG family protein n=1 Tax=Luoshenia tenuis TaxID=2763654 RepID=A0A926HIJ2_9FIRM|nr:OadG family transporter subunit [Luoshenia tenuis]MBC8528842.1 OadG family protein [Luoshenia tenuis]